MCSIPVSLAALQRTFFVSLSLEARGLSFQGLTGLQNQEDSSWHSTTSRTLHRWQTESHPSLPRIEAPLACPGALALGTGFCFGVLLEVCGYDLREQRWAWWITLCSLPLLCFNLRVSLYPCLASWFLQLLPATTLHPRKTVELIFSRPVGL